MIASIANYFARLFERFGEGWTRFWFIPSDAIVLSLIRLLTGLVAVYLHATLSFDLVRLFGSGGLLPVGEMAPLDAGAFSYLNYLSEPAELWAAHLIGLAILVLFAAGFWTRVTTVLALVVFLSDIHRAPMITSGTEPLVAIVMFYLCFAPCGQRFSLDSLLAHRATRGSRGAVPIVYSTTATIVTRLIQLHLVLWIAMMGFSKLTGEAWWTGLAMWWLIARPESRLVDLTGLYAMPKVIDFWSHVVVLFELGFPLLIWIPLARPLLLGIAAVVWWSLALVTGDLTLALMLCIASLAFVPPAFVRARCDRGRVAVAHAV
jgi:hypothetical protein